MAISFKRAREALSKIDRHRNRCLIIHYACQSLYDNREGLSPRIANIVIKDFANDQTVSFAVHLMAEKMRIPKAEIEANFDKIETSLLDEFYSFVQNHTGNLWLHWNMINIQYGFETLAHRYYVLTGKNAPSIDIENRINIAGMLIGLYGEKYAAEPHMQNLMMLNGGRLKRDFVPGVEEVALFEGKEYARLHASTAAKVRFFSEVVELALDHKLRIEVPSWYYRFERVSDHPVAKLVGLAASIWTIVSVFLLLG